MALSPEQIEKRKQAMLNDPEFMAKLQARLADTLPEHRYGSKKNIELVAALEECRKQIALREDFEALAAVAWELVKGLVCQDEEGQYLTTKRYLGREQHDLYAILQDYYESEEDDEEDISDDSTADAEYPGHRA